MKTILKQGIAVNCKTEKEAKEFFKILHNDGYVWCSGESLLLYSHWEDYKEQTCYCIYLDDEISYCNISFYSNRDCYKVLPFIKWKKSLHTTITEHLIIGKKTIIKLSNGKVGVCNCYYKDEFDEAFGTQLAIARAFGDKQTEKYLIERKFTKAEKKIRLYFSRKQKERVEQLRFMGFMDNLKEPTFVKVDNKWVEYTELCSFPKSKCNWSDAVLVYESDTYPTIKIGR